METYQALQEKPTRQAGEERGGRGEMTAKQNFSPGSPQIEGRKRSPKTPIDIRGTIGKYSPNPHH